MQTGSPERFCHELHIPAGAWPLFSRKVPYMPFPPLVFSTSKVRALLQKEGNLH